MKLEAIQIKRYRSIEEIEVRDCGNFNVFIGKNACPVRPGAGADSPGTEGIVLKWTPKTGQSIKL